MKVFNKEYKQSFDLTVLNDSGEIEHRMEWIKNMIKQDNCLVISGMYGSYLVETNSRNDECYAVDVLKEFRGYSESYEMTQEETDSFFTYDCVIIETLAEFKKRIGK